MNPPSEPSGQVSVASAQGERDHQEDRAVYHWVQNPSLPGATGWLLGVFDGHGGAMTAQIASQALVALFEAQLQTQQGRLGETFREVFASLNALTQDHISGSTAAVVFIPQEAQTLTLAVLGDSPVAVLDSAGAIHVGPDHNVRSNLQERAQAEARGGIYWAGYLEDSENPGPGLQMARSLGDAELSRVLNREPEIQSLALGGKGIVLVGTDGLLAPGGAPAAQQLAEILELIRKGAGAEEVVKDALARRTGDNVTVVLWQSVDPTRRTNVK